MALVERLELAGPVPCALAGSVIVQGRLVRREFEAAAMGLGLELMPIATVPEPAVGAVRLARLALDAAGVV